MKKAHLTIEVADDFEKGDCFSCPMSYIDYGACSGQEWVPECVCVLHKGLNCPLNVEPPEDFMNKPETAEADIPIPILVDYVLAEECQNLEAWYTCYKCGKCGRLFENGIMVDDGGTNQEMEEED